MKIGNVTLQEWEPGQWRIRYFDPRTGKDIRMRLNAGTYAEAVADAEKHNRYCRGEAETAPHLEVKQRKVAAGLTVKQAMTAAESELNYGAAAMKNHRIDAARFVEYAEKRQVTRWKQVTRELIRGYYRHMKSCKLAHDTIRLRLLPVRITSAYWALESSEYTDEFRRAKINHKRPNGWEPEIQFLTLEQVQAYLAHLKKNLPPKYHAMAMLGLYTGMRQLEIVNLRTRDIDVKRGIITVCDTDSHEVKTATSTRKLPVPPQVLAAIKDWPVDADGLLFTTNRGKPYTANTLSKEMMLHVLKSARANGIVPVWFTAKKTRPTFATLGGESGVGEIYLQRMMGHAPANTMRRFYHSISVNKLSSELATFWQLVSDNSIKQAKSKVYNA